MEKSQKFESLRDAKFRSLENEELQSASAMDGGKIPSLDTVTVTQSGSRWDSGDPEA